MREIKVAATQMACSTNTDENVDKAIDFMIMKKMLSKIFL